MQAGINSGSYSSSPSSQPFFAAIAHANAAGIVVFYGPAKYMPLMP